MTTDEIKGLIGSKLEDVKLKRVQDSLLIENPLDLIPVAKLIRDCPELELDYLSSVTGADYVDYLESVYFFYSMKNKTGPLLLRVRVSKDSPHVPSLVPVFRGAEYQEREAYDMYGILYDGHPDLRRLFMWEGFEGYPMRKDYTQEDSETLEKADIEWLERENINVSAEVRRNAEELSKKGSRALPNKKSKSKS